MAVLSFCFLSCTAFCFLLELLNIFFPCLVFYIPITDTQMESGVQETSHQKRKSPPTCKCTRLSLTFILTSRATLSPCFRMAEACCFTIVLEHPFTVVQIFLSASLLQVVALMRMAFEVENHLYCLLVSNDVFGKI